MSARLAALIVNYDSAAFALACLRSLEREWLAAGRARGDLEIVVVDNASPRDAPAALDALESAGARVVRAGENLGYARGMNLALERAGASELVAVLNPDLAFLPGSLARLLATLAERPDAGAVAPACFVDPECAIGLPPIEPATPHGLIDDFDALADVVAARRRAAERARGAAAVWTARAPLDLPMLSGACLLMSRAAIARAGGLFDARYPLYYEDTDLARRLAGAGLARVLEPRARVVHHWARSSGVGAEFEGEPRRRHDVAQREYLLRWHGADGLARVQARAAELAASGPATCPPIHDFADLGETADPVELGPLRPGPHVIELALAPHFPLAAGVLADGPAWRPHARTWEWLFAGRVFARALERETLALAGAWTFVKTSPPRTRPLELAELAEFDGLDETRARP